MFSMECKGIHHVIGIENIAKFLRVPLDSTDVKIQFFQLCSANIIQAENELQAIIRYGFPVKFFNKVSNSFNK
jgi:hypothetical protein